MPITALVSQLKIKEAKPALEYRLVHRKDSNTYDRHEVIKTLAEIGDEGSARVLVQELKRHLRQGFADSDDDRLMTALVAALAKLKYMPARAVVYETIFFWKGYDDAFAAHPELLELKQRLEKQLAEKAVEALPALQGKRVRCLVFLRNREELAANPKAEPRYTTLVRIDLSEDISGGRGLDAGEEVAKKYRSLVAETLKTPLSTVGLQYRVAANSSAIQGIDERLGTQPADFLLWRVCEFLRNGHDANDDRFVRWLVAHGQVERGLVEQLLPGVLRAKE
jgi:hypothetical protein